MDRFRLVGVIAAALFLGGCGVFQRVSSEVLATALLIQVKDPLQLEPDQSAIAVRVGLIEDATSDNPKISPLASVNVTVADEALSFGTVTLAAADSSTTPEAQEAYVATSQDSSLVYNPGARYVVTVHVAGGDHKGDYTMGVVAPAEATLGGIPDPYNAETHTANTPMTVTVSPAADYEYALVAVVRDNGGQPEIVYDNRPQSLGDWLSFLSGRFDGEVEIPAEAFPDTGTVYGLSVTGMAGSKTADESANLNFLSKFLAGTSTPEVVCTDPISGCVGLP